MSDSIANSIRRGVKFNRCCHYHKQTANIYMESESLTFCKKDRGSNPSDSAEED